VSGELVPCGDADNLGRQLMDDKVQLGVFHGIEFAWARQKYPEPATWVRVGQVAADVFPTATAVCRAEDMPAAEKVANRVGDLAVDAAA
jgi:hypothetical protein